MDALKQQLLKAQQQLAGLSASQKMLTASLLVIMVMTLFYWSHFASTTEMEAVATPAAGDVAAVKAALDAKGIHYEMQGDRILVASDRKLDAQAALSQNPSLPLSTDKVFDDAIRDSTPFESAALRDQRLQIAKQKWLAQVMQRWPNVTSADVLLSGEKKLGVLHDAEATATVNLMLSIDDNKDVRRVAGAARSFVAKAQAGLDPKNVGVTVNGQPFKDDSGDAMSDYDDQLAIRTANEKHYEQRIYDRLHSIPGVTATVSVKLVLDSSYSTEHKVDPKNHIETPTRLHTESEENTPAVPAGEPGTVPNTGVLTDQPAPAIAQSSTKETNDTTNTADHGTLDTTTNRPAGPPVATAAAVTVPESYLRKVWKGYHKGAEPTDDDVKTLLASQTKWLRGTVKAATGLTDDSVIMVDSYADFDEPAPAEATGGTALAAMPMGVGFGIKESAIAALAVISLFMVMMMVKKGAPQPVLAAAMPVSDTEPMAPHSSLLTVNEMAGEVSEGSNTMMGHELSEEALEAKQVIEQVGAMVKDNPEVAANLVKRWLNQD